MLLSAPDNLTRIDGLRRYLRELNRQQGLGLCLRRKRLTSPLVTSTLAKGVGVMAICFPILLVLHGALGSPALLARSGLPAGLADPLLSRAGSVEWE